MKKKILIVTHGFYPEQSPRSFRATELAKEFCRQGHDVTVMAPQRDGTTNLLAEYPIKYNSLGTLKWKIYNLKNFGVLGTLFNKVVNRFLPLLFEYPGIELYYKIKNALKRETKVYDLLISIAVPYPVHWGVAYIWKKNITTIAKIWVADCGDPFYLQRNDTFRRPFYFKWIEIWFMKKPDYVTVPTDKSYIGYLKQFHHKLRVIPQGFKFTDIVKREAINDGIVRFGYGGLFIKDRRDPTELLTFLTELPLKYKFEFHIYTNNIQFILPYASKDSRIVLHEPISRKDLLETFSTYQFVVNFSNPVLEQTPSKLIDYAIIEKPILNIVTGNLDRENVLLFLNGNFINKYTTIDSNNYKIENVAKQFIALCN